MTEDEITKVAEEYRKKAPIDIPDTANFKAQSKANRYEQITYKWNDAIDARNSGLATQEQIELLDKGHWKE